MAYRRATGNIRKPRRSVRRRAPARRRAVTRRRTYRRRAPRRVKSTPAELNPSTKFALAQLDPFEPQCLGAKVPDSNTMPSIANCDIDLVALAGPGASAALTAVAFNPSYRSAVITATPGASSVSWDTTSGSVIATRSKYSQVAASIEATRAVAHAIRISSPLAPTSTTGFVHIGLDVESRYNDTGSNSFPDFPTTIAQMSGLAHYKRVTLASLTQSPITVINKWIDETAFRYEDPRANYVYTSSTSVTITTANFNMNSSWGTLVVMVEGSPTGTSTQLSFEHILLSEFLPKKDAFIIGNSAAPNSPGLMGATSVMVANTDFAHTEAEQESYISRGVQELASGLYAQGERAFNEHAPAIAQRVASHVGTTMLNYTLAGIAGLAGIGGVNNNPNRLALTAS